MKRFPWVLIAFLLAAWPGALPADELENDVVKITYIRFGVKDWKILHELNGPYTVHVQCKRKGKAIVRQTIYKDGKAYKTNTVSEDCPRPGEVIVMNFEIIDVKKGFTDGFDLPDE